MDVQGLKKALTDAGIEIYRTQGTTLQIAERVRLHIMDSGIRVALQDDGGIEVRFTARAQRSDFGSIEPQVLFDKVRHTVGPEATARGFAESTTGTVEVKDPVDAGRILDVWYEISYAKALGRPEDAADAVRWALSVEKYVQ
ncbi:MAG: hypothetical protein IT379_26825 [Deltaproteobacteria bacterium]|nr:hypothetical protein [Deltaproteobacteria bacterium]